MDSLYLKNNADETWGTDRVSSGSCLDLVEGVDDFERVLALSVRFTAANFLVFLALPMLCSCLCSGGVWWWCRLDDEMRFEFAFFY